jgi:hypothetical protein
MQLFQWIATNWQAVCGWVGGLYLIYHIGKLFIALVLAINSITDRAKAAEDTLSLLATNHFPHLQLAIERVNENLEGLRRDLAKILVIEEHE